jgi:hypothetical protein
VSWPLRRTVSSAVDLAMTFRILNIRKFEISSPPYAAVR